MAEYLPFYEIFKDLATNQWSVATNLIASLYACTRTLWRPYLLTASALPTSLQLLPQTKIYPFDMPPCINLFLWPQYPSPSPIPSRPDQKHLQRSNFAGLSLVSPQTNEQTLADCSLSSDSAFTIGLLPQPLVSSAVPTCLTLRRPCSNCCKFQKWILSQRKRWCAR